MNLLSFTFQFCCSSRTRPWRSVCMIILSYVWCFPSLTISVLFCGSRSVVNILGAYKTHSYLSHQRTTEILAVDWKCHQITKSYTHPTWSEVPVKLESVFNRRESVESKCEVSPLNREKGFASAHRKKPAKVRFAPIRYALWVASESGERLLWVNILAYNSSSRIILHYMINNRMVHAQLFMPSCPCKTCIICFSCVYSDNAFFVRYSTFSNG